MKSYNMFIDGKWVPASSNETIEVLNPANEEVIATVPMGTREDARKALESAREAQVTWSKLTAQRRGEYLRELANELLKEKKHLAELLTTEQGKLISMAYEEVEGTAQFISYAAESARRIQGEILYSDVEEEQIMIQRIPYGVTVGLLTWNFPLALAGRKLGNALITGNTMVLMPPLHAPLAVYELGKIIERVLPKGVINIVTGAGNVIGDELVRNPITKLVTLTGSTEIGRHIYKAAADNLTVISLELGGKAPFIVLEDADIDKAAKLAVLSGYDNCGQICTSNERMYIHKDVYDEFMEKFVAGVKQLKVGNPMDPDTNIGPKMNINELNKLVTMVDKAKEQGAKIIVGGNRLTEGEFKTGYWFEPTVITNVTNYMEIIQEETFGPIVAAMKVESFDEALQLANDCKYGLSGYIFTKNMGNIMRAMNELEVGEIYVNRRNGELINGFHAGIKLSGVGGEDGKHGLDIYSQKKTIYLNYGK
ncbi:aldehyde dehydrogenase [Clostridium grantii]|uniref:3-sulfolactaldehyde dehydrogenase n=1 Tax=Clostridium grantii DSM 8605 TaxID=1121316 RepID=A0A1M5U3F7_9CLOT|nr:aldehyde dehydrogenase [Clostridium grantii]SHH57552.1 lactaldehyde dehydrogenase / glycolaldehyde dehydrogenase [Clostridium grantii DSM 8605]